MNGNEPYESFLVAESLSRSFATASSTSLANPYLSRKEITKTASRIDIRIKLINTGVLLVSQFRQKFKYKSNYLGLSEYHRLYQRYGNTEIGLFLLFSLSNCVCSCTFNYNELNQRIPPYFNELNSDLDSINLFKTISRRTQWH